MLDKLLHQRWTISNGLIVISAIFTAITFIVPNIYRFGMNDIFLNAGLYQYWFLQIFTSQFLHWWVMHLLMNAIFILYFWNVLERIIGKNKMLLFFICSSIFLGVFLTLLNAGNTVWISWFALAVLTYYTLTLWKKWNPEYTGWITAIVVNILIGLSPGISFFWHFGWMLFGGIWWFMHNRNK